MRNPPTEQPSGEFIVYRTDDGTTEVHLRLINGSVWLSQRELSELYGIGVATISRHLSACIRDGELDRRATVSQRENVALEQGRQVTRQIEVYNLDAIMAVGYRVRGPRGNQFRQWATVVLRDYLVKGFAMNDAKLKDPAGADYFTELLERIRDIRASEKRFYHKICDLIAATSIDYDKAAESTQTFFASLQNKLLYAVTGLAAAEIICARADASSPNMGLTTWSGARVRKSDITIAKNYLTSTEISQLNRLTTMFLDYAEDRAQRRVHITMTDWLEASDKFLVFNERAILRGAGSITRSRMESVVNDRYALFDKQRKLAEAEQADADDLAELEAVQTDIERRR